MWSTVHDWSVDSYSSTVTYVAQVKTFGKAEDLKIRVALLRKPAHLLYLNELVF